MFNHYDVFIQTSSNLVFKIQFTISRLHFFKNPGWLRVCPVWKLVVDNGNFEFWFRWKLKMIHFRRKITSWHWIQHVGDGYQHQHRIKMWVEWCWWREKVTISKLSSSYQFNVVTNKNENNWVSILLHLKRYWSSEKLSKKIQ